MKTFDQTTIIGKKVAKYSRKPFKSKEKINTVSGFIMHPELPGQWAFTFLEDDSYVAVAQCFIIEEENKDEK